jgi:acetylornithine deacetylase/succinyl-diaminopimelate desuccinylase-like protein
MGRAAAVAALASVAAAGSASLGPRPPAAAAHAAEAGRLAGAEMVEGEAYALLQHLTDRIGPRLTGSAGAEAAVAWAAERLRSYGLTVRTERVMVPHWVRGVEEAELVAPAPQRILVTALGGSEPTPAAGLTAEVVEAMGIEGVRALGQAAARGKIVLFNAPMTVKGMAGYGPAVSQRTHGAAEAARLGAVAALVRSVGTLSSRLVHTGAVSYDDPVPHIPAGAITAEDADLIHRLLASGETVRLSLRLGCRTLPDVESANVVADLEGREAPDEVVLIGAHLDSWDLGTGAVDDAAGVAMVMETLRLLKALDLRPRRTVRGVLYMNEENGLRGGKAYAAAHASELHRHVAALETDSGAGLPDGLSATVGPGGLERLQELAGLLRPLGADAFVAGGGGADIEPLHAASVPLLGLRLDTTRYFDWHHSPADTLDKVDPRELAVGTAALAIAAYVLADMPETLPRPAPPSPSPAVSPRP